MTVTLELDDGGNVGILDAGDLGSASGTVVVTVAAVAEAPTFTLAGGLFSGTEQSSTQVLAVSGNLGATMTDDDDTEALTMTVTGSASFLLADLGSAAVDVAGHVHTSVGAAVVVVVTDNEGLSAPVNIPVTVTPVNSAPVVTAAVTATGGVWSVS